MMKPVKIILGSIQDLVLLLSPQRKSDQYKFAFIVHPRTLKDIERKFSFFSFFPTDIALILTRYLWPVTVSKITGLKLKADGRSIEGYVISVFPTAQQMMENRPLALKRIIQACILAKKRGARIVGLGGLTSSLSKGGLELIDKVDVNITTGHAYTSYNVTQNIISIVQYMEIGAKEVIIGIVGAAGSIGSTTARLLAKKGFMNFVLIDLERKKDNCMSLMKDILDFNPSINIKFSHQIRDIKSCDIVVAATNSPESLIRSVDLKHGAIVVDDAQPSDVHPDVFLREDVLVIEAGVTHTPDVFSNFNFGLKKKEHNFCCLAEVLILAANEWDDHYVINRPTIEMVEHISNLGNDLKFKIAEFQNFAELISNSKLDFVKKCIKQNEFSS